jgi:hypothetical protein
MKNQIETHVCLVSAQATPNLLPVFDEAWRPRRVVLAASDQMTNAAQAVERVIKGMGLGIKVEIFRLPDPYDYQALFAAFVDLAGDHARASGLALNVTGGTKLMAVAAQEVFRENRLPVFYVSVETDEIIVLGGERRSDPLRAKFKVKDMLDAHGFSVESSRKPQVRAEVRDLSARLIDRVGDSGPALGQLNYLASEARSNSGLEVNLNEWQRDSRSLHEIVGLFEDAGQLKLINGRSIRFPSEAARFFVNGGWLEDHVYQVIQDIRGQDDRLTDVAMSVKMVYPDHRTRNEADIAFLHRNTLHLIECKTANLAANSGGGDDKATEAVYKMETLLKLGGLRTRGLIVDYRGALSAHSVNIDRAKAAGIKVVGGRQLRDLRGWLQREWLTSGKR